ncbi:hypothetical protein [Micromonospora sp. CPCC 206061]|uniref:hypothetical protein n=1 Tax=Micromonospora sp. CPCC 206061 TaxID=3122410 RepID=UPI002FF1F791
MNTDVPTSLLYLLTVGRDKELVLRLHDDAVTTETLAAWMRERAVRALTVSRLGDDATSTLLINFGHIVGARLATYSDTRTGSF